MDGSERIQARLENVETVRPILSALRMIALGSYQNARRRQRSVAGYVARLGEVLAVVEPLLGNKNNNAGVADATFNAEDSTGKDACFTEAGTEAPRIVVIVGSERGLCGRFNTAVVDHGLRYLDERPDAALWVLGEQARRQVARAGREIAHFEPLQATTLPSLDLAARLVTGWRRQMEAGAVPETGITAVDFVYHRPKGVGSSQVTVETLLPQTPTQLPAVGDNWPPPIVETDPLALYEQTLGQWLVLRCYRLLLASAEAEQGARFQLLEAATQNAERLVDELTLAARALRRAAITREVQALAVGAGLVGR